MLAIDNTKNEKDKEFLPYLSFVFFDLSMMINFEQLQIGDYFRIAGMNPRSVYRKASSSHCTLGAALQPIRHVTELIRLTPTEVADYFAHYFSAKLDFLESLRH